MAENLPNYVNRGPVMKIVTVLPPVGDVGIGEMYFLISDKKIYIRVTDGTGNTPHGWLATAALT